MATTRAPRKAFRLIPSNSDAFSSVASAGVVELAAAVEVPDAVAELERIEPVALRLALIESDIVSEMLVAKLDAGLVESLATSSAEVEAIFAIDPRCEMQPRNYRCSLRQN